MNAVIGFLKHKLVVQIAGVIALYILIWFVCPKVSFGESTPFETEFNRLVMIVIVTIAWALYNLIMLNLGEKKEQQLMSDLSAAPPIDSVQATIESKQAKEIDDLQKKFQQALHFLKHTRSKGWYDKKYLYELPWYVIIGAPGCGKTTLLSNSGLNFPLSAKIDRPDIQGVSGTRNCDWFFTDDAIFLDTAGRYATQDSQQEIDATAWNGFLDLIKKYRPQKPINGVLVSVSISDLIYQSKEKNQEQADLIRQRIVELSDKLGLRFPVYMIFTKCDLVAGFTDLFYQLDSDKRAQIWGETFTGDDPEKFQEHIDQFTDGFEKSLHGLNQWAFRRIQEEKDIKRKSLIFDFPRQMAQLKPDIKHFLLRTFSPSPYEKYAPMLRGVYLTSGTQKGTPIDGVMNLLASMYGLDHQQLSDVNGQGKSFFIARLLKNVIIPEARLAALNPRMIHRQRFLQAGTYGLVLLVVVGIIMIWSASYARNKSAIDQLQTRIDQYNQIDDIRHGRDADVTSLVARMNVIKSAENSYEHLIPWTGFGLDQRDKLKAGLNMVYEPLLKKRFFPFVKEQLEQHIYAHLNDNNEDSSSILYDLLKTYLMLGSPRERLVPLFAEKKLADIWPQSYGGEQALWVDFNDHTNALLHLSLDPMPLNASLIAKARQKLKERPLHEQIFMQMQAEAESILQRDFFPADILGPDGVKVFVTEKNRNLKTLRIPAIFTYEGYHDYFVKKGENYVERMLEENWVLDNYPSADERYRDRFYADLKNYYFSQYKKQWLGLLYNLKIKYASNIDDKIQTLEILSAPNSPIIPLLKSVERHTTLFTPVASTEVVLTPPPLAVKKLEREFQSIHRLVQGTAEISLEDLLEQLSFLRDEMIQIASAEDKNEAALQKALERISRDGASERIKEAYRIFARQPEPLNKWFLSLTSSNLNFTLDSAKSELSIIWKENVFKDYKKALQGCYPIDKNSDREVAIVDFNEFFKPDGIVDDFIQKHVQPFFDTTRSPWQPKKIDNQTINLSSNALAQLQRAASIRNAFYPDGGTSPLLHFELKPIELGQDVAAFQINIDGQEHEYKNGPIKAKRFQWPNNKNDGQSGVMLRLKTIDGECVTRKEKGDWAWLRVLERAIKDNRDQANQYKLVFKVGNYSATYELRSGNIRYPFPLTALRGFRCPEAL